MNILVIDDEAGILNSLRREIIDHDHEFTGAASAEEGLEIIEVQQQFDVVISDHMMPGMKGIEFLSIVQLQLPGVLRILLSGQVPEQELAKAIRDGVVDIHVSKPWDSIKLFEMIECWKRRGDDVLPLSL